MPTIGKRVRRAREYQFLTQIELSEVSGIPVVTISRIENDRYRDRPRLSTLRRLASSLKVDPVWLLHGAGKSRPPEMLSALFGLLSYSFII